MRYAYLIVLIMIFGCSPDSDNSETPKDSDIPVNPIDTTVYDDGYVINNDVNISGYSYKRESYMSSSLQDSLVISYEIADNKLISSLRTKYAILPSVSTNSVLDQHFNYENGKLISISGIDNSDVFQYDDYDRITNAQYHSMFMHFSYLDNVVRVEVLNGPYGNLNSVVQYRYIFTLSEYGNIIKAGNDFDNNDVVDQDSEVKIIYRLGNIVKILKGGVEEVVAYMDVLNPKRELMEQTFGRKAYTLLNAVYYNITQGNAVTDLCKNMSVISSGQYGVADNGYLSYLQDQTFTNIYFYKTFETYSYF